MWHEGQRVDLAYRDYGVADLLELEAEGVDVEPMRVLLRENRMVSSIAADLDQKACWEVLTDPRLCQKYFTAEERQLFQRHILWTRVLCDRRTVLPDGRQGNLLEFARDEPRSAGAQAEPLVRRRRHRDRPGGHPGRVGAALHERRPGRSGRPLGRAAARHRSRCGSSRWSVPTARCTSSRSTR